MIHLPHHLSDPWPPTCSLATPATLAFLMFLELVSLVPSLGLCTCCVPCLDCIPSKGSNPTCSVVLSWPHGLNLQLTPPASATTHSHRSHPCYCLLSAITTSHIYVVYPVYVHEPP